MVLLLDNHDSFVYNLARYVRELGFDSVVRLSDAIGVDDVAQINPTHIILSPGPCTPAEAGICSDVVRAVGDRIPILGVCLGHQCIAEAYGGKVVRAMKPMHGRTAPVYHMMSGILAGIPSPFAATRYHSLIVEPESCPPELRVTGRSSEGEIMALEHETHPVHGVQFHPESVATEWGYRILANFLGISRANEVPAHGDLGRSVRSQ